MHIRLQDDTPVKKSYMSVPPPLYKEVQESSRPAGTRLDQEVQVPLLLPGCVRQEERWLPPSLYRLPGAEQ